MTTAEQKIADRGPRWAVSGIVRPGETRVQYADTAEWAGHATASGRPRPAASSGGSLGGRRPFLALAPPVPGSALLPGFDGRKRPDRSSADLLRFRQIAAGVHPVDRGALDAEAGGELVGGEESFHAPQHTLSCWA